MRFSNKLSFAILATGLIVLIISSFTLYNFSYNSIINSQFMYTQSIADEVSDDIDHLLHEKVKITLTLANAPIIKKALETSNLSYAHLSDEKRKKSIKLLNEKWKSTKDPTNNFILKFTDNKVSHFLKNQQALLKGEYGEIFLTNKFGALVASTAKLSTLAHGHKYWWLGSYNNGEGAVFFDDRGYDDSVGGYVLGLVVPIRKGTEIIGILKCNLNILGSISKLISGAKHKLMGNFKLTRSGGMIVFEEGFEPLSTQVHGSIFEKLKNKKSGSFIINDSGEKYIVGCSEIEVTKGGEGYGFGGTFESIDHKKGNTGESWYVVCSRQMSAALMPFTQSIKTIILIGIAIILILVLVSYLFGRRIAKPLAMLNKATEKIGKGDFKYRIGVKGKDEFGNLAQSFNNMASKLQQTTTSIVELEHEITERKQAEEALVNEKDLSEAIIESIPGMLYVYDDQGNHIRHNKRHEEMTGYSAEELSHLNPLSWYDDKADILRVESVINDVFTKGYGQVEAPMRIKNGEKLMMHFTGSKLVMNGKKYFVGVGTDISERKQSEVALRERTKDLGERVKELNCLYNISNLVEKPDISLDELMQASVDLIPPSSQYPEITCSRILLEDKEYKTENFKDTNWEQSSDILVHGRRMGVLKVCYLEEKPETDEEPFLKEERNLIKAIAGRLGHIIERIRAEEERKQLQDKLQQSQKMEAVGTLAGGIAHDFNNILAVIFGNVELASDDIPDWNPASKSLKAIHQASIRAKDMVKQLLAFSRKSDQESKPLNMTPVIKESMKMLRTAIPSSVDFSVKISDEPCNIMGDATQMNQIMMNLVTNAAHAMSESGGGLEVTLEKTFLQKEEVCFDWVLSPGAYVSLKVRDTGEGIDPGIIDRIFDPYFTTKEVGKGTGMGLSVIHGIVKSHDGGIRVESEVGKGTVFEIYFPALEKMIEEEKEPDGEIKGGSESILFVDDEQTMVDLNRQRLERLGYQVKSTTKPVEALEWFKANPEQFDVIITDMTMPRMTGDRLAAEVLKIRPQMPVIICTGYSERMSAKKAESLGVRKYIEKPIDIRNLAAALREVLGEQ